MDLRPPFEPEATAAGGHMVRVRRPTGNVAGLEGVAPVGVMLALFETAGFEPATLGSQSSSAFALCRPAKTLVIGERKPVS